MGRIAGWTSSIEERPAGVARGGRALGSEGREEAGPAGILVGRVAGAHGLRGQLRVRCFGDEPESLLEITRVSLDPRNPQEEPCRYEVSAIAPGRSGELRVALAGVRRREQAEALLGRNVRVDPDQIVGTARGKKRVAMPRQRTCGWSELEWCASDGRCDIADVVGCHKVRNGRGSRPRCAAADDDLVSVDDHAIHVRRRRRR